MTAHPPARTIILLAGYCAVVSAITWPLFALVLTGNPGFLYAEPNHCDTGGTLWFHWWFDHALRHGLDFFNTPFLSYPAGENIWITAGNFLLFLVGWPIMHLRGLIAGYNTIVWLICLLNCMAGYYLMRQMMTDRIWAFIGGIGIAFNNYIFREMWSGRLEQVFVAAMVLGIAMLVRLGREPTWRSSLGWASAMVITALFSWHYGIMLGGAGALAILMWCLRRNWNAVRHVITGGAIALLSLLPVIVSLKRAFAAEYSWQPVAAAETVRNLMLATMRNESLDLATLQLQAVTISRFSVVIPLAALGVGLTLSRAVRRSGISWIALGVIALVLSLGPSGQIAGYTIPLPFGMLINCVPFMARFLWPVRFIFFFYLASTVLFTMIARDYCGTTGPRLKVLIAMAAALLIWSEINLGSQIFHHLGAGRFTQPGIYHELAGMPTGAMLEIPVNNLSLAAQTLHGKPLFSGSITTPAPIVPERTRRILDESGMDGPPPAAPTHRLRVFLNRYRFRYLLLNEKRFRAIAPCDAGRWRMVLSNYEKEFGPPIAVDKGAGLVLFAIKQR